MFSLTYVMYPLMQTPEECENTEVLEQRLDSFRCKYKWNSGVLNS